MDIIYSSRSELNGKRLNPALKRQIGVIVSKPFEHMGEGGKLYVSVEFETPAINTLSFGKNVPLEDVKAKVLEQTDVIIKDLDALIEELTRHRDRMHIQRKMAMKKHWNAWVEKWEESFEQLKGSFS